MIKLWLSSHSDSSKNTAHSLVGIMPIFRLNILLFYKPAPQFYRYVSVKCRCRNIGLKGVTYMYHWQKNYGSFRD